MQSCAQLGRMSLYGERGDLARSLDLEKGIKVDREKVKVIKKLPPSISVKVVRSFVGHKCFYKRFINDISKIVHPL